MIMMEFLWYLIWMISDRFDEYGDMLDSFFNVFVMYLYCVLSIDYILYGINS